VSEHGQSSAEPDRPTALADAIERAVAPWLERCVVDTATAQLGTCPAGLAAEATAMGHREAPALAAAVREFLALDVEAQRGTPLSVLRAAVVHPTAVLHAAGVPPVERDDFARRTFPDDVYGLVPASWSDLAPEVQDPGIVWGAWKAAVVLARRRPAGDGETGPAAAPRPAAVSPVAPAEPSPAAPAEPSPGAPITRRVVGRGAPG
jgi:hypothetical protein